MQPYTTIFFGTPDVAIPSLRSLLKDKRFSVQAVVSQKAKPAGRKQELQESDVTLFAQQHNLPIFHPENLKNEEFSAWMQTIKPDIAVVVAYGMIIPKSILAIPTYGFINVHYSLLPHYRGASPVQYAILHNDAQTGVTMMKMNEKLDEGDILFQLPEKIQMEDTYFSLAHRLSEKTEQHLPHILHQYITGKIKPVPQDHLKATYTARITKEMGKINWNEETALQIFKKMKAFTPWPGVFTFVNNKRLKILDATVSLENYNAPFGQYLEKKGIQTKDGILVPLKVQMEGKKEMSFEEFLRGVKGENLMFG